MAGPWSATTTYQIARGDTNRRVAITALLADTLYDIDISSSATFEEADTMRLVIDTQDLPIPALSALTGKAATTGTIRLVATLTHNDTAETVYFRHRADGTTAWTSAGSVTVGAPTVLVARSITGLARGTTYEIQASLAADYSTPTTVTVPLLFNFDPLATANTDPSDLWGDNTHLYVLDRNGEALYAYHLDTKAHDASRSIDLSAEFPPGSTPVGAWGDDTTLWVLSTNGNIEAYTFATLAHEPANTITLAALSGAPSAMHVHGDKLYVAVAGYIDVYSWPDGLQLSPLRIEKGPNEPGLWIPPAGDVVYVPSRASSLSEVLAYSLALTTYGNLVAGKGWTLHTTGISPYGLWSDGDIAYLSTSNNDAVYAYDLNTGTYLGPP